MDAFSEARLRAIPARLRASVLRGLATLLRRPAVAARDSSRRALPRVFECVLWVLAAAVTSAAFADIQYVYDENGRLVQVVDPAGTSALYTYDAAGNIVALNQVAASTVSISEFTANAGPVGSTVNVYGTGFSATPSSNTVKFNGTSATVTSSSATQLIVTVPSAATTGKITVLVGGVTATSAQDFTVNSGTPIPTFTGFSPTVGTVGTAVTVNGTNFETNVANDKLRFNGTLASITSATSTQLASKVPVFATSGRLDILTSYGSAISSGDFFVPPGTYTSANVGYTGRMSVATPGSTIAMNTGAGGQIGLLLFDGVQGQKLSIGASNVIFGPSASYAYLYVKKPDGGDLLTTPMYFGSGGEGVPLPALPVTGTYTILIVPAPPSSVSLTVSLSQDSIGTITPGGPPVTVSTQFAGQRAILAFQGTQNQRVSLRTSGVTIAGGYMVVSILKPDGTTLVVDLYVSGPDFIDVQSLPVSGSYLVVLDPAYAATATATLTLYDVPADTSGTIAAGGASVPVATTVPGQSANLTFTGTPGQRISLAATGISLSGGTLNSATVSITKPDGTTLASLCCVSSYDFIDTQVLPASGTYTVTFHPGYGSTGSGTLKLYDVPPDVSGTITAGGAAVPVTTTVPGQNANLTFSGTVGQRVSLGISGVSLSGGTTNYASVLILKPDGNTLASTSSIISTGFIDLQTLPTTGTYTVRFDPANTSVGNGTLTLFDVPADAAGTVTIGGSALTLTTTVPGQNAVFSFAGTAAQQVTVHVTGNTMPWYTRVYLRKPDNSILTWTGSYDASFNLPAATLPTTGTYTVLVDPDGASIGSAAVNVTSP